MDTGRLSQGQMISAIAGVVLVISLFLKWVGADLPAGVSGGASLSGWEANNSLDIYLFIVALFAIVPAALEMGGGDTEVPFADAGATFLLGAIGTLLTLYVVLDGFPDGTSTKIGAWVALIAVAAVTFGAYQAMSEELD
jgi:hypothetical protein